MHEDTVSHNFRTCVIIPAFNEEKTVGAVIASTRRYLPNSEIVIINDGSLDATAHLARKAGATVLDLPFNLGIGGAVQTGLKYAYRGGFDAALEIDADGQHDPVNGPQLLKTLQEEQADMVIGSRFIKNTAYQSSVLRRFGIHLFSWLIKMVTGKRIYDSTSGFRAYNRKTLRFLAHQYPADFPEPESIVMLLMAGFRIREVPVQMYHRQKGVSVVAHDMSWRALYFVISNAIAILVSSIKPKRSYVS